MNKIKDLDAHMHEYGNIDELSSEFINRELSWLDFNNRILERAKEKTEPVNERLKYLGISSNNLDEFISVRFASVLSDKTQREVILKGIKVCLDSQKKIYRHLKSVLEDNNTYITKIKDLSKKDYIRLKETFMDTIYPLLVPININVNLVPNLDSAQMAVMATVLTGTSNDNKENAIIIPISNHIDKLVVIDNKVLLSEEVILEFLGELFINKEITDRSVFKLIRNLNNPVSHEEDRLIAERMSETVRRRKFSQPIFLQTKKGTSKKINFILMKLFGIEKDAIYSDSRIIDFRRFMDTKLLPEEVGSYRPFTANEYEAEGEYNDIISSVKDNEILLHHPYDSYDTVLKFIQEAAVDPNVTTIKQTLYRVSSEESPIINSLIEAASNGKDVAVLVEVKARFDETRNIRLIERLNNNGVNVVFGSEYLKTHCKFCIIGRKEESKIRYYAHIATGNYNEKTSKIYTDLSYFTSDRKITSDMLAVFNILSGLSSPNEKLNKVLYSPINLRAHVYKLIDNEVKQVEKGRKGEIILKLNSLSDEEVVDRLYKAAKKGVKITIICRGICSIKPKKNITIKSIVGRFLEHSRIYYFRNGGSGKYYISSADLLTRNLDRRIEVMVRIDNDVLENKLGHILDAFIMDRSNSFIMDRNTVYHKMKGDFNSHQWFIDEAENKISLKLPKDKKKKK